MNYFSLFFHLARVDRSAVRVRVWTSVLAADPKHMYVFVCGLQAVRSDRSLGCSCVETADASCVRLQALLYDL